MVEPRTRTIRRFFKELYGEDTPGYIVLFDRDAKRSRCFRPSDAESAAATAAAVARLRNIYFGIGLQDEPVSPYRRGTWKTVSTIPGAFIDIDIASDAHAEQNLPTSLNEALELVYSFPLPPTMAVHSGHGIQAYLLFNEPLMFESDDERLAARTLLRRYQNSLRAKAEERGWSIESTADLARVYRPPGTINHKLEPVSTRVIEFNSTSRYEADEIAGFLPEDIPGDDSWTQANPDDFAPADLDVITDGCAWMRHCREDAAHLDEPQWYAALSIIGRCLDGDVLSHQWSEPHPGYSYEETDVKVKQASENSGPRTCKYIREQLKGERYCSSCAYWGKVKSPIRLGEPERAVIDMTRSIVTKNARLRVQRRSQLQTTEVRYG